jgi:hypothetical protein
MFILRRMLGEEGVESNTILGDSYNVVYKDSNPGQFRKAYETVYGPPKTGDDNDWDKIVAFIEFQSGQQIQPIYRGQPSYIMTPGGATFSGLVISK